MNGLAEVCATWNWWKECIVRLKMCPTSMACQYMAMQAQKDYIIQQALYWNGVWP